MVCTYWYVGTRGMLRNQAMRKDHENKGGQKLHNKKTIILGYQNGCP